MKKIFLAFFLFSSLLFAKEIETNLEFILGSVDVNGDRNTTDTTAGASLRLKAIDDMSMGEFGLSALASSDYTNYSVDYVQGWVFGSYDSAYVSLLPLGLAYDYYKLAGNNAWVLSYKGGARVGFTIFDVGAFYSRALLGKRIANVRFKPELSSIELGAGFGLIAGFGVRLSLKYQYLKDMNSPMNSKQYIGAFTASKKF